VGLKLVLVSGPPGCGKSTLSRALATKLGIPVLDKDSIDEPFSPEARGEAYTRDIEPKVLEALFTQAAENLGCGVSIILDAPWTHIMLNEPTWAERAKRVAKESGAELVVLECVISDGTLRKRIEARGLVRDAEKLDAPGWTRFCAHDRVGEKNPLSHRVIDMEQSAEACVAEAVRVVGA